MTTATATPTRPRSVRRRALPAGGERFAAYVAHELRTPIALQRALVEVTLADPRADADTLRATCERVLANCFEQQAVIEALLDLVRCGRRVIRHEPVDLAATAAGVLRAAHRGPLGAFAALEPARTVGDPKLVERLVANLVSNAIRHNRPHGRLEVATRTDQGRVVVAVANTGPLVPASEVHRLFQPFQRLRPDAAPADGLGLGLAIVDAIAAAHRARVNARPRAGGGLAIDVTFPAPD